MTTASKVDYSGRTVDLLLLKTVLDAPVAMKRVDVDVSGTPMIVTGVEKLVQRYALLFLTALGSVKFASDRGTNMIPMVGSGLVYDMATLEAAAAEANMMARNKIADGDADEDTPDDELLTNSEIEDLEFSRLESKVKVSVRLTTAAGQSYLYIIPVAVGVH